MYRSYFFYMFGYGSYSLLVCCVQPQPKRPGGKSLDLLTRGLGFKSHYVHTGGGQGKGRKNSPDNQVMPCTPESKSLNNLNRENLIHFTRLVYVVISLFCISYTQLFIDIHIHFHSYLVMYTHFPFNILFQTVSTRNSPP